MLTEENQIIMYIPASSKIYNWDEYTLIVPAVSVGNVGQLAADLIISTIGMERAGYILHEAITPVIGNNPFAQADATTCNLTSSCEVYESLEKKIMVIQQRAPLIKGRVQLYVKWLAQWIKEKNFHQIVIIGSTFSHERLDFQMDGSPFRILKSSKMQERLGEFFAKTMGWRDLESRPTHDLFPLPVKDAEIGDARVPGNIFMPGSGIARPLFDAVQDIPVLVFLMFCSEGDNAHDAIDLAQQLNGWMNLLVKKDKESLKDSTLGIVEWKIPTSWQHFYGTSFDQTLFH